MCVYFATWASEGQGCQFPRKATRRESSIGPGTVGATGARDVGTTGDGVGRPVASAQPQYSSPDPQYPDAEQHRLRSEQTPSPICPFPHVPLSIQWAEEVPQYPHLEQQLPSKQSPFPTTPLPQYEQVEGGGPSLVQHDREVSKSA
mmetsp:Transcript_28978/g.60599  ORF Transcript_28978/g.60599 Transcript_28978/m.60599 type:complete len:146 (-) Transcript_28978:883-1320(-)